MSRSGQKIAQRRNEESEKHHLRARIVPVEKESHRGADKARVGLTVSTLSSGMDVGGPAKREAIQLGI
jgi:hypothetical protein